MREHKELTFAAKEEVAVVREDELMERIQRDRMLSEKDDKIYEQSCLLKEVRRQVAASRDEELRVRTRTYWRLKVKDDEIQEQSCLLGELRCQFREQVELTSAAGDCEPEGETDGEDPDGQDVQREGRQDPGAELSDRGAEMPGGCEPGGGADDEDPDGQDAQREGR